MFFGESKTEWLPGTPAWQGKMSHSWMLQTNGWFFCAKLDDWRVDIAKFGTPFPSGPFHLRTQLCGELLLRWYTHMSCKWFDCHTHLLTWYIWWQYPDFLLICIQIHDSAQVWAHVPKKAHSCRPKEWDDWQISRISPCFTLTGPETGKDVPLKPASSGQIQTLCTAWVCADALCWSRYGLMVDAPICGNWIRGTMVLNQYQPWDFRGMPHS